MQPVELKRIKLWDQVVPIFTKGEYPDGRKVSTQGTLPYEVQYVPGADAKAFAKSPTDYLSLVPTIYNADTLGLRPDQIRRPIEHWSELFNPEFKGKAALVDIPSIGIMDAAMAIESRGDMKYADKGNMTKAEIDKTVDILTDLKKPGPLPRLLEHLRPVGEPDGLGRGRASSRCGRRPSPPCGRATSPAPTSRSRKAIAAGPPASA